MRRECRIAKGRDAKGNEAPVHTFQERLRPVYGMHEPIHVVDEGPAAARVHHAFYLLEYGGCDLLGVHGDKMLHLRLRALHLARA